MRVDPVCAGLGSIGLAGCDDGFSHHSFLSVLGVVRASDVELTGVLGQATRLIGARSSASRAAARPAARAASS